MVYSGAGNVAPAPLSGTIGNGVVDVVIGLVVVLVVKVVVEVGVVVEVFVVVEVEVGLVVTLVVEVDVGIVAVVEEVVVLLQALNTKDVTINKDVTTTSHFLLNLLDNLHFSFILFTFIIKGDL